MTNHKLNITFLLIKSRLNKLGRCSILCRITYNKNRKEFSTGLFIIPSFWDRKRQKAEPPNEENSLINKQLSLIENKIRQAFLLFQIQGMQFDVYDIYRHFKGEKLQKEYTILEVYEKHNIMMKKLIGIDFKKVSCSRYIENRRKVDTFIKTVYKRPDVKLKLLDLKFVSDFENYLKVDRKLSQATINRSLQRLRKVVRYAIVQNYITSDPFVMHKLKKFKKEIVFLSTEELKDLEKHHFSQPRLQQVKDWFVFSCYTGLAYNEIKNLKKQHIVKGFDGMLWIEMKREKTKKNIAVPILPKAQEMIDKYTNDSQVVFEVVSNHVSRQQKVD